MSIITSIMTYSTTRKRLIRPWLLVPGIFWSGTNVALGHFSTGPKFKRLLSHFSTGTKCRLLVPASVLGRY